MLLRPLRRSNSQDRSAECHTTALEVRSPLFDHSRFVAPLPLDLQNRPFPVGYCMKGVN